MNPAPTPAISPDEEIPFINVDWTDFAAMSRAQQIRNFEVEGYIVFPSILNPDTIARIKRELAEAEMSHTSYSVNQTRSVTQPQWLSRAVAKLIGYPPMIDFLSALMGPDIVFTRGFFQRTLPGSPGISMHTDGQPHGSNLFGYEGSCPRLLRVLYYLDELTTERAPFRLIPRSHLSFHAEASPYARYKWHPEEITLVVPAGTAVVVPSTLMHGSHPNKDARPRELVQLGYRPAWAGPIQPVEEWDARLVEAAPAIAKPFLKSLNTTGAVWEQQHKPAGMKTEAPGISPSRWGPNFLASRGLGGNSPD
jgi:ectoine hydroxylase-related dioxygenase (phytanoyl-CoA dioxygenase family)